MQKKREKDAAAYRRALKDHLDRQLAELEKLIAALDKKIEKVGKEIDELGGALEEKYGPNWEEELKKLREGKDSKLDLNDPIVQQMLLKMDERDLYVTERDGYKHEQKEILGVKQKLESGEIDNVVQEYSASTEKKRTLNSATAESSSIELKEQVIKALDFDDDTENIVERATFDENSGLSSFSDEFSYDSLSPDNSGPSVASTIGESAFGVDPLTSKFTEVADPEQAKLVAENEQQTLPTYETTVTVSEVAKFTV